MFRGALFSGRLYEGRLFGLGVEVEEELAAQEYGGGPDGLGERRRRFTREVQGTAGAHNLGLDGSIPSPASNSVAEKAGRRLFEPRRGERPTAGQVDVTDLAGLGKLSAEIRVAKADAERLVASAMAARRDEEDELAALAMILALADDD